MASPEPLAASPLAAELAAIRERNDRARHPEDDDGKLYIAAAAVAVALGEAPGWTVRRSGVSVEVYEDGRGVPAWRVWVERGTGGHLIGDGEFGRSARDVLRLLAAVEAVLKRHDEDRHGSGTCVNCFNALGEHLSWRCPTVQAITRALLGEEAPDAR